MADFYAGPTGRRRLLRTYERAETRTFDGLLYCCAVTVEDALLQGGAVPGVDYTRIRLFEMAMPLALAMRDAGTSITCEIPDSHPHAGLPVARPVDHDGEEVMQALLEMGASTSADLVRRFKKPVLPVLNALIKKKLVTITRYSNRKPSYYLSPEGCIALGRFA